VKGKLKAYARGRTPPPPFLEGWRLATLEGVMFVRYAEEYIDGSWWLLGVLKPLDGGRPAPVEAEVTRAGDVYITPRAGWAGLE
jgi:hypothetical protein